MPRTKVISDDQGIVIPWKGTILCGHPGCKDKKAYHWNPASSIGLCGRHVSAKIKSSGLALYTNSIKMKPDPDQKNKSSKHVQDAFVSSVQHEGKLQLGILRMMTSPINVYVKGYQPVLPNAKSVSDPAGFALVMRDLSPKLLGPVVHGQPGLPIALNLENFHQFGKVFKSEFDSENDIIKSVWYDRRIQGYNDPIPHRHKLGHTKAEHLINAGLSKDDNANICIFSVFVLPDGREMRSSYIDSRIFYCTYYERLASVTPSFKHLLNLHKTEKKNLLILGFDAGVSPTAPTIDTLTEQVTRKQPPTPLSEKTVQALVEGTPETRSEFAWMLYRDADVPFGHEKVLLVMLLLHNHAELYPWRVDAVRRGLHI